MGESISARMGSLANNKDGAHIRVVMESLRKDVLTIATSLDVLAAKLNADEGVTDVNYAKVNVASLTTKE